MAEKARELTREDKAQAMQGMAISILPTSPNRAVSANAVSDVTGVSRVRLKERIRQGIKYLLELVDGERNAGLAATPAQKLSLLDRDSPNTAVSEAAKRLLLTEGYDVSKTEDLMQIRDIIENATKTYDQFNDGAGLDRYPDIDIRKAASGNDRIRKTIYRIFVTATRDPDLEKRALACAILRYVLATDYRKKEPRLKFMKNAENYIEQKLKGHLFRQKKGEGRSGWRFRDDPNVSVLRIEHRMKTAESMDRKLLTHADVRAEDIMDSAGVTVICESYGDILRLVTRLFFDPNMASLPAHKIRNERTRNKIFSAKFEEEMEHAKTDTDWAASVWDAIMDKRIPETWIRPFDETRSTGGKSLPLFRTFAITVDVPIHAGDQLLSIPVEIQFMTEADSEHNKRTASHEEYAGKQIERVVKRTKRRPIQK